MAEESNEYYEKKHGVPATNIYRKESTAITSICNVLI